MAFDRHLKILENLALSSVLGFIALLIAAISFVVDSRIVAEELSVLAPSSAVVVVASHADDPSFDRIYRIQTDAAFSYASVVSLRSSSSTVLVGVWFTSTGELRELRFLGSCSSQLPSTIRNLIAEFPGAETAVGRATDLVRRLANGTSEGGS